MYFYVMTSLSVLLFLCVTNSVIVADVNNSSRLSDVTSSSIASVTLNSTDEDIANNNETAASYGGVLGLPGLKHLHIDVGAVRRTFYVIASLTGLVFVFVAVKVVRSRRRRKTRRYGLLVNQDIEPLDDCDEDEDTTLFDANRHKKSKM